MTAASIAYPLPRRSRRRGAWAAALALLAAGVLLLVYQADIRIGEAVVTQYLVGAFTEGRATASGASVYFGIGSPQVTRLSITALCSTVVLVAPLLVLSALITMMSGNGLSRIALATALAVGIVIVCNALRFAAVAFAYQNYGMEGFDLVHRYIGSLFVIAGFIAATVLLLIGSLRRRRHPAEPPAPPPVGESALPVRRADLRRSRGRR